MELIDHNTAQRDLAIGKALTRKQRAYRRRQKRRHTRYRKDHRGWN